MPLNKIDWEKLTKEREMFFSDRIENDSKKERHMSIGTDRVRVRFNPSSVDIVDEIKQNTADLIDLCETLKQYDARLASLAQTYYEIAAMLAVKAATTETPVD